MQRLLYRLRTAITFAYSRAIEGVVVDAIDIADKMFPAIIPNSWACGIDGFSQMVDCLYVMTLSWISRKIRHAPALVERYPGHNARMVVIAFQYRQPFASKPLYRLGREDICIGHLTPN